MPQEPAVRRDTTLQVSGTHLATRETKSAANTGKGGGRVLQREHNWREAAATWLTAMRPARIPRPSCRRAKGSYPRRARRRWFWLAKEGRQRVIDLTGRFTRKKPPHGSTARTDAKPAFGFLIDEALPLQALSARLATGVLQVGQTSLQGAVLLARGMTLRLPAQARLGLASVASPEPHRLTTLRWRRLAGDSGRTLAPLLMLS
jgi:hypothetical protein